ncbi:TetR/AcrR family transcriptional regulator [Sciscionella sediminilitoris]|uniref:TetR/AcrR family transcriptional regulator n=1 Tax=Sciscionella sediminilitoris TaxID=1445613 RepID=UPI0004DFBC71|nr:TetR family transcriptional regulator [Sciscionella sp. SE31]
MSETDGRRLRGARKRESIIAAALRLVEREGVSKVTHRAVAAEAGVPSGSVSYYFATLDDLLIAALTSATEDYTDRLRELTEQTGDQLEALAQLIAECPTESGRARAIAERELNLLATRRPALRPVARTWREAVAELAHRFTADPAAVCETLAVVDGMCVGFLLEEEQPDLDLIRSVLRNALRIDTETS